MTDEARTPSPPGHSTRLQAWLLELAAQIPAHLPKLKARLVELSADVTRAEERARTLAARIQRRSPPPSSSSGSSPATK